MISRFKKKNQKKKVSREGLIKKGQIIKINSFMVISGNPFHNLIVTGALI